MPFFLCSIVEAGNEMALALEKVLNPAVSQPVSPATHEPKSRLNIAVIFTSIDATLAALRQAGNLANKLGARISLLVPQIVPYPLPLTSPPVLLDWNERRFHVIAEGNSVETSVRLYLCRDRVDTVKSVLSPHSLVVIGGRKRWWPTSEKALARKLRRVGHEVIFVETE